MCCILFSPQLFAIATVFNQVGRNALEAHHTAAFLTPQVPRGSDTDNEVTAFPKGCNDLAPQQHVLAYLVESGLI